LARRAAVSLAQRADSPGERTEMPGPDFDRGLTLARESVARVRKTMSPYMGRVTLEHELRDARQAASRTEEPARSQWMGKAEGIVEALTNWETRK
jgi:hypothetical protein